MEKRKAILMIKPDKIQITKAVTMDAPVRQLQALGFTQYESQAYVALLQKSPLTGYELARVSGVPRANIYAVLDKLEEHGAVVRLDTKHGMRYLPVTPEELIRNVGSRLHTHLEATRQTLCQVHTRPTTDQVHNFYGYDPLIDHFRALTDSAGREVLVAFSPEESLVLSPFLETALGRGVSITTLCLAGCPHHCGTCLGDVHRHHLLPAGKTRYLLLVQDREETLAGEIDDHNHVQAIRTRQKLIVELISWHIRNSIAVSTILTDTGRRLDNLLSQQAWAALASIGDGNAGKNWLEHFRQLLEAHHEEH